VKKRKKKKDYSIGEKTTAGLFRFIAFFPIPAIILVILWMMFA